MVEIYITYYCRGNQYLWPHGHDKLQKIIVLAFLTEHIEFHGKHHGIWSQMIKSDIENLNGIPYQTLLSQEIMNNRETRMTGGADMCQVYFSQSSYQPDPIGIMVEGTIKH